MNVLIVAKTHAYGGFCVGGLANNGQSLRLMSKAGGFQPANTPLQVGQVWDLNYHPAPATTPPHVENVWVQSGTLLPGGYTTLAAHLQQHVLVWAGGPPSLFGGTLVRIASGSAYVPRTNIPGQSTGYWQADQDLRFDGTKYYWYAGPPAVKMAYKGVPPAPAVLPAGTLLRVSLSTWFQPPGLPDGCWLQLSGWYV